MAGKLLQVAALLALAVVLSSAPGTALAGATDEADRQAGFAQDELAAGDYERALRSAESALRLDPTRYDAFLLKARAYEGLGDLELAESLVRAYGELVGGLEDHPEAQAILQRIEVAQTVVEAAPRTRTALLRRRVEPEQLRVEMPEQIDAAPYRERVVAALAEGRCNAASSAAAELTMTAPDVADGWKLAGDAARCGGDLHEALLAYRRYQREGGDEASTMALVDRLAGKFGTLLITVDAPAEAAPIRARLDVAGDELLAEATPEGALRLRDLLPGQGMILTVSGRGLRPIEVQVEPVGPGEVREIEVAPEWLGLATVAVAEHDADVRVVLLTEDSEVVAGAGQSQELSAASAWALVENKYGVQSVPLPVEPGAELEFDPAPYLPARLAVAGVPAGSTVAVEVTADDGRIGGWTYVLPYDVGAIDIETGVRVAPVRNFDSLPGGVGTLRVEHPTLGQDEVEVVLETGTLNGVTFDWRPLPGVKLVGERYAEWQAGQARVQLGRRRIAALGVASGVLAAVGGGLLVGALVVEGQADVARDAAVAAHDAGDSAALTLAISDFKAAQGRSQVLGISAGVGFGLAGVGLVVTFGSGGVAKRRIATVGAWRPEAVE
jgi:tetratricopeptide (TPR) repeat protein